MPCNSCHGPSNHDDEARRQVVKLEAMLCALIKVAGLDAAMDKADWAEAGVDAKELRDWWTRHKEKDRARREQEARATEQERLRQEALAKLSPAERAALGLGLGWRFK